MPSSSDARDEYEEIALHIRVSREEPVGEVEPFDVKNLIHELKSKGVDGVADQLERLGLKVKVPVRDIPETLDQGGDLAAKDGCISNPGGPSC
ncbi:MAG: hypothetical protein ACRDZO_09165 [Egibacteraceae bacterium]